jgi:ankyrin repeat protein
MYEEKYLKYKSKYVELKNINGGTRKKISKKKSQSIRTKKGYNDSLSAIDRLINKGVLKNTNKKDTHNTTTSVRNRTDRLLFGLLTNNLEIVKDAIAESVNVNDNIFGTMTPLNVACLYGHINIVNYLIDIGANINKIDGLGNTAIYLARKKGHTDIVNKLLTMGA